MNPEAQPDVSAGQRLYRVWCDSAGSNTARYWTAMNTAEKIRWEALANLLDDAEVTLRRHIGQLQQTIDLLDQAIRRHRDTITMDRESVPHAADLDLWSTVKPPTQRVALGEIALLLKGQEGANVVKARQVALRALER
jgi:hypothetical protein